MTGNTEPGGLITGLGPVRSLPWFGELQALSNLMFMLLAWDGKDYHWIDKRDTLALSV